MHISIVDDEKMLTSRIQKRLESEGYMVSTFGRYQDFMQHGGAHSQFYLIDIGLMDGSGFDIIRWLRDTAGCTAPIMIISGYGNSEKIVYGLGIGADDYMVKPLIPDELVARIKALLRRPMQFTPETPLVYRDISYSTEKKEVRVGDRLVSLTHKESMLLELLIRQPGKIVSRQELINVVWGGHKLSDVSDNTINATISKIRRKIGPSFRLKTLYSEGYILE